MRVEAIGKPQGCKLIRISAVISDADFGEGQGDADFGDAAYGDADHGEGRIVSIRIRGDFFACPEERFDAVEEALAGTPVPALAETFDSLIKLNNMETFGISGAGVAAVLNQALKPGAGEAESGT